MKNSYSYNEQFRGLKGDDVTKYLGIPYAYPPIGKLRFKAPQILHSSSVKKMVCEKYPSNPFQNGLKNISEDCLQLNIWKPNIIKKEIPVMVWIYGGSFETGGIGKNGAGFGLTFNGEALAKDTQCLIVTVNYRLNVFGFLDFTSMSDQFESNIGLKDIVCALKWIQENISEFGGDPNNVTLFGQSAGGAIVAALSKVPSAQSLFHKMIVQSACLESFYTKKEAEKVAKEYLKLLNIREKRVSELIGLSPERLISVNAKLERIIRNEILGITTFCPVVDGDFLTEFPCFGNLKMNKPMIIGSTKNEGRMFTRFSKSISKENGTRFLPFCGRIERESILSTYPHFPSFEANSQVITDLMYTIPKYWMVNKYDQNTKVYVYSFNFYSGIFRYLRLKACHASDIPLLFNIGSVLYLERALVAKKIGKNIRRYWGEFARTGDPNGKGLVLWKPYSKKEENVLVLKEENTLENGLDKEVRVKFRDYTSFFHPSTR